jgi:hypothetical protein
MTAIIFATRGLKRKLEPIETAPQSGRARIARESHVTLKKSHVDSKS